jgi:hypothetical protein
MTTFNEAVCNILQGKNSEEVSEVNDLNENANKLVKELDGHIKYVTDLVASFDKKGSITKDATKIDGSFSEVCGEIHDNLLNEVQESMESLREWVSTA